MDDNNAAYADFQSKLNTFNQNNPSDDQTRMFLQKNLPQVFPVGDKTYERAGIVEQNPWMQGLGAAGGGLLGAAGGSVLGGLAGKGLGSLLDTDDRTSTNIGALVGGLGGGGLGGYLGHRYAGVPEEDIGKIKAQQIMYAQQ